MERAAGVGDVEIVGGLERAIDVRIDVDRLAAYRIPITAVRTALQRQNAEIPGGNVDAGRREMSLRTLGRFADARAFSDLVVATVNGSPVRLARHRHAWRTAPRSSARPRASTACPP